MKYWLDSDNYRPRRKLAIDFSLLCRAYYEGYPYNASKFNNIGQTRWNLLENLSEMSRDKKGEYTYSGPEHQYEYNIAKLRVDQMVNSILPHQAQIIIEGIVDDDDGAKVKEYIRTVINPGSKYPATLNGLKQWMRAVILDAAQVGDRLAIPRFIPRTAQRQPFVLLTTFSSADWDAELDEETNEPDFYRLEFKRFGDDGKAYWHRFDIFKDHIQRYEPQRVSVEGQPAWDLLYPGLMDWDKALPHYFSSNLKPVAETAETRVEAVDLGKMSETIATPIRYGDRGIDSFRGIPEVLIADMRAIDKANRHLSIWARAVEDTNFPAMIIWDAVFPKLPDGTAQTNINLRAGSQHQLSSAFDTQPGRAEFPDNVPTEFAFAAYLDQIATIAFGSIPNRGLKPEDVRSFSQMSGFAHQIIAKPMDDRVKDFRTNSIDNGILPLFRKAHEMAQIKGILPSFAAKVEFKMTYGKEPVSADEALKQMLVCQTGLSNLKLPPRVIVPNLPFQIDDEQEVIDAMEQAQEDALAMTQALKEAALNPPAKPQDGNGKGKGMNPKDEAGVDNNAR
jgi:hypothetical protein